MADSPVWEQTFFGVFAVTVKQITPRTAADYGEVCWDAVVTNQDAHPVATYDVLTLVGWPTPEA